MIILNTRHCATDKERRTEIKKTLLTATHSMLGVFWYLAVDMPRQIIKTTARRCNPVGTVHIRAMVTAWDPA
jgi:hypothetical protein